MINLDPEEEIITRAEKREKRKRRPVPKHGKELGEIYKNSIEKRVRRLKRRKD